MKKTLVASVLAFAALSAAQAKDIVDTAVAAGSFKTLVTAVQAAGLVDTVSSLPCTVFTLPAFTSAAITLPGTTW